MYIKTVEDYGGSFEFDTMKPMIQNQEIVNPAL